MKPEMTFQEQIHRHAENAVVKLVSEGGWIQPDYANRLKLPANLMEEAWAGVDLAAIKLRLKGRIEAELADRVMNHLAAEMATDIKQLLGNTERREALRAVARNHLDAICNPVSIKKEATK